MPGSVRIRGRHRTSRRSGYTALEQRPRAGRGGLCQWVRETTPVLDTAFLLDPLFVRPATMCPATLVATIFNPLRREQRTRRVEEAGHSERLHLNSASRSGDTII